MGKDTTSTGRQKGNSDDENWRRQRKSNSRTSSPRKSITGASRVSSSSSLPSSSSGGHRRRGSGSSSSSSASSSRTSSTTSVSKPTAKESQLGSSSSRSHGNVDGGNFHSRRNKRMRTKSVRKSPSHPEEAVKTLSLEANSDKRRSSISNGSSLRGKGDDGKSRHQHETKGNRADEDLAWRKRSPTTGTSSTKEACANSLREPREVGHGRGRTNQPESRGMVESNAKVEPQIRKSDPKQEREGVKGSEEIFDFASDIFKDGEMKSAKGGTKSNLANKADLKKEARTVRLLKLSDERRKKEYLGYQPAYVHKLYSFGIDNKGKKEPQKTGLSKKEEDTMFRKRAVYMMHLEEERKRKEREDRRAERSSSSKHLETNMKDVRERLKEAVERKNNTHNLQGLNQESDQERKENVVKETNRLLQDLEAALPDACELEAIPEVVGERGGANEPDCSDQTKHEFAEALNLRINQDKSNDNSSNSSEETRHEHESTEISSHENPTQFDIEEFEMEESNSDLHPVGEMRNCSASCDALDGNEQSETKGVTSDHDVGLMEKDASRESGKEYRYFMGLTSTTQKMADPKIMELKREGDQLGRHCGLPSIISDNHNRDSGKVIAVSRKENVVRISPETVCFDQQESSSDKAVTDHVQQLHRGTVVSKDASSLMKNNLTSTCMTLTEVQGDGGDQTSPEAKVQEFGTGNAKVELTGTNTLPKHHASRQVAQENDPVLSIKKSIIRPGPSSLPKVTPNQQYAKIAPAKTVSGIPMYALPSVSSYVQASPHQALIGTSVSQVGPKGNVLSVFGNQNQSVFQTGGNVCLQKISSSVEVKAPTIQLSHCNRSLVTQVNNTPCLSMPPLVVLPKNILQGVPSYPAGNGPTINRNIDGSAIPGACGIGSGFTAGSASQPKSQSNVDQILHPEQMQCATINDQKSAVAPSANKATKPKSGPMETAEMPAKSQGLLGYINVPVIKDDQGRLVIILPNDKTIMGSNQIQKGDAGKTSSKGVVVDLTESAAHRDFTQTQAHRTRFKQGATTLPKDVSSAAAQSFLVCTEDVSSQSTDCKSSKSEQTVETTTVEKPLNVSDGQDIKQMCDDKNGKSSKIASKKTLENADIGNRKDESVQSKSVDELRVRQKAITSKLKELRSVRVLIAKHGRMEETECVRMVERLKQVEDLFFRQLIATSKELDERLKNQHQVNRMDTREMIEYVTVDSTRGRKSRTYDSGSFSVDSNMTSSRTSDRAKRSDETVDKLFNTAHLLRNCINAMAKKRYHRRGGRQENDSKCSQELEHEQVATEEKGISHDAKIHKGISSSTVSTEQESDMSIGSPQAEQYHLQPTTADKDAPADKIILRLQRVRNRDDSTSVSIEDAMNAKSPGHGNDAVEKDKTRPLPEVPTSQTGFEIDSENKTDTSRHSNVNEGSNQSLPAPRVNDSRCTSQAALSGSKNECKRDDREAFCKGKVCCQDDSSNESTSERSSRLNARQPSSKDKKYAVFTGPTKEQIREEDRREREIVKEAWNRVFPNSSYNQERDPHRKREDSQMSDNEQENICSKSRGQTISGSKAKQKQVKHVYGNPVIRGNLTSIGNINVTRQVGGSSETKFQWLLKQLQKKRNGGSQSKQKDQLRMQTSSETRGEDGREYVSLISRGVQAHSRRAKDKHSASTSRTPKDAEQEDKENLAKGSSLAVNHDPSTRSQNGNSKKRGRESTGSGGKPQEKLPRIQSPSADLEVNESTDQNEDLQDLISLREEVLSRQSSSSEDTVEYSDNLISVEENVRRLKPLEKDKKKLKSTGTMTASEIFGNDTLSTKQSTSSRKFATKTRGHGRYSWCKKKISKKISKSKGRKKCTTGGTAKTKAKAKMTPTKKNAVILISDDSLQNESEAESPEKEKVTQKTKRNTLASLSARLWDECYWSTINDTSNPDVATVRNILPSNNSPPTTRRTGLETKMLDLWSDLLRYSGNNHDVDSLPVTLEDIDKMDLPPALRNSMKILLEGYDMVKQASSLENEDSECRINPRNDATLNENNSAEIREEQHDESIRIPWEEPKTEDAGDMTDSSPAYDEESRVSSSTWGTSTSNEFSLDALTSHSENTVRCGPTYHSSSTTASPPSLSTEDGYVPVELPETNLRRWPTSMELTSGTDGHGGVSPDYSADVMNRNDPHEEGDSGRSGSERADALAVGVTGWQISGAGDLREPRLMTAPNATARNRRRQNRVMSWPNIIHEEEESDDDIPLAKLIDKERLKRLQRETAEGHNVLKILPEVENTDGVDEEASPLEETELPGPFLLAQTGQSDLSTDITDLSTDITDTIAEEKYDIKEITKSDGFGKKQVSRSDQTDPPDDDSHARVKNSFGIHPERPEEHRPINNRSVPLKKSGKFLYGDSKKGKSLVKKRDRTLPEISQQLSSNSSEAGAWGCGRRFVVSCSPPTDSLENGNHLYYRSDLSPDIFE